MRGISSQRLRAPLLVLLIAAGAVFGLAPMLIPTQFASATGFAGTDVFVYRLAGAASFCYTVGLIVGFRAPWPAIRIAIVATLVFNLGSIVACLAAIARGGAQPVVYLILVASVLFVAGTGQLIARPPVSPGEPATASGPPDVAQWFVLLFGVGTAAALVFGLAPLIFAGSLGPIANLSGTDDFVYRQAGAATLGAAIGGLLALQSRRWVDVRILAIMALTFNGLSAIVAVLEIARGGSLPVGLLILAAAGVVAAGMIVGLRRNGR